MALVDTVAAPEVTHVESFGSFESDIGVKDTVGSGVVGFEWCAVWRLWVTHFLKGSEHWDGFLGVQEKCTGFGFGGGCGDSAECLAKNVDGAICFGVRSDTSGGWECRQEKMTSSSSAAGIGEYEVSSVGANGEDHITGVLADCSIWMRVKVIKEHVAGGLLIGDFVQGNDNSRIATSE